MPQKTFFGNNEQDGAKSYRKTKRNEIAREINLYNVK